MAVFENNRALLERFRRGERDALTEVYEYYVDQVATLARRGFTMESQGHVYVRGADPEGEHELVQETFAKAFAERARASYDGLRPYRPFLLRITKNLMIDRYRQEKRLGQREGSSSAGDIDEILEGKVELAVREDPHEDLHWKRLSEATREFLAEQSQEVQDVVRLRFEEAGSQDAVAQALGISRRRVRTLEARIQKQLHKHLKSAGLVES
jgi:RNA polymerase sigma factor (sigma-70 family)